MKNLVRTLAATCLFAVALNANAGSIAYETVQLVAGENIPTVFNAQFQLGSTMDAGPYEVTLTDFEFTEPFTTLVAAITTSVTPLALLTAPGTQNLELEHGITYFVNVGAQPSALFGQFGVRISAVPIPASVVLLGSAVAGLVVVRRRRSETEGATAA